ncbi:MAG: hypothetical protein LBE36_13260 [Flavobacteriaceae bacterium]|jgi:hypothetical protein|nr:hypothetical protein [Flavobacteriaceae bacterium]
MLQKITNYYNHKNYVGIVKNIPETQELVWGYIVDFSENFIVVQEIYDFIPISFVILPMKNIKKIYHRKRDKYFEKILKREQISIALRTKVDLTDWVSIMKTFQKKKQNIIAKCEDPDIDTFTIGEIKRVMSDSVYIRYFDAFGFFDKTLTKIEYKSITAFNFDDIYTTVFSKYTRERKP